jgi:hypothetical protein
MENKLIFWITHKIILSFLKKKDPVFMRLKGKEKPRIFTFILTIFISCCLH